MMFRLGYGKYGPVAHEAGSVVLVILAAIWYCRFLHWRAPLFCESAEPGPSHAMR